MNAQALDTLRQQVQLEVHAHHVNKLVYPLNPAQKAMISRLSNWPLPEADLHSITGQQRHRHLLLEAVTLERMSRTSQIEQAQVF